MVLAGAVLGGMLAPTGGEAPRTHHLDIRARQFAFEPHRVVVDRGDRLRLRLSSEDVVHGLFLEGQKLDLIAYPGRVEFGLRRPDGTAGYVPTNEVAFTADRWGKFRYRCSTTCGPLHPFMLGELVVRPNYPFWAGVGALLALVAVAFGLMWTTESPPETGAPSRWRIDLLARLPWLKWYVQRRWFQLAFMPFGLFFLTLLLLAGFWGSPIGSRNIIITFVWILWWFLLKTVLLPFGARAWCTACPIPFFGEWFQRRRLVTVRDDVRRLWASFRPWPRGLSNLWLQNVLFLLLCTFSAVLVTTPVLTACALLVLLAGATLVALRYRGRAFCSYLCPVSGFLSLYSMASLVEVRAKNPSRCHDCQAKSCRLGSEKGWGCPWSQVPGRLERNNNCGMCMECIKTCPNDNMTLRLRPFCTDVGLKGYDEAWTAFIMVTLALVYSVTLMGPWGTIKTWANVGDFANWRGFLGYAGIVWSLSLLVLPGLWLAATALGRHWSGATDVPLKVMFPQYAYVLVPVGLCAWIAFGLPLMFVNGTHILATVSDPLGWGWDLVGATRIPWAPLWPEYLVYLQIPLLLFGLAYGLKRGFGLALELQATVPRACRSLLPTGLASAALVAAFLYLFAG